MPNKEPLGRDLQTSNPDHDPIHSVPDGRPNGDADVTLRPQETSSVFGAYAPTCVSWCRTLTAVVFYAAWFSNSRSRNTFSTISGYAETLPPYEP